MFRLRIINRFHAFSFRIETFGEDHERTVDRIPPLGDAVKGARCESGSL